MAVLAPLFRNESGGRNVPNVHEGTSSGQAQGYFQITTGTWNEFGGQQYAPTPLQATPAQQWAVASKIPLKRWDKSTITAIRNAGGQIDTNRTLGENVAANGEVFHEGYLKPGGGGGEAAQPVTQTDPNWRPARPGQGQSGGTGPLYPPTDPNWRPTRPGQQQSSAVTTPLTPPQVEQFGPQMAPANQPTTMVADAKKAGWRDLLAKAATGWKPPAVALADTALTGMAIPRAARIDQPEVPMFDPNAIGQQRQQLAMAMQHLNTGKLFL
jgi:hypothetical protein